MKAMMRALMVGLVAFVLLFGLGQAMAGDVPSATDTGNTLDVTVSSVSPVITGFDITDSTPTSVMHGQLDVQTTYYFNVTINDDNGWGDLNWTNIRIWYDNGTSEISFSAQDTGANYRADLNYTNAGDLTTPNLGEWNVTEGNIAYNSGDSSIYTNTVNQNYTFNLSFQLNAQIHQADDPVNSGTGNYDDLGSWNAEVRAKDADNPDVINRQNATNVYHEFGVFQYTSVSIATSWSAGTVAPGASGESSAVIVTHQANRNYTMTAWFDTTLDSGANTIPVGNIEIMAAGDAGDAIDSDIAFGGLLEANEEYIHGSVSSNRTHDFTGNSETTGVQFRVNVPFGTPSGTYTATLTIKVEIP